MNAVESDSRALPVLLTIAPSHYCEKARWALERFGVPYREETHMPLFHRFAHKKHGAGNTTPALVTGDGVFDDSTKILHYLDARAPAGRELYPRDPALRREVDELEEHFDEKLGPHTRRLAYFHLMPDAKMTLEAMVWKVPPSEERWGRRLFPLLRALMRKAMQIDAPGAARSRERIEKVFGEVAERLRDGRRYLVGDRFTAADLTFAALSAPGLLPSGYGAPLPSMEALKPELQAEIAHFREHPAGAFALRMYAEERRRGAP